MSSAPLVGSYSPSVIESVQFARLSADQLQRLSQVSGLSAEAADFLEERGFNLSIPASVIPPLIAARRAVGYVVTLRYLPRRMDGGAARAEGKAPRLAFRTAWEVASPGDIVVMDASFLPDRSIIGGNAMKVAAQRGVAGCIVDGAIRDVDEIQAAGVPVWARWVTPMGGTWDVEAVEINRPVACCGIQVRPGDLAIADDSGVSFLPNELASEFFDQVVAGKSID